MKLPPPSKNDKRMLLFSGSVFLAACILVGLAVISRNSASSLGSQGASSGGLSMPLPAAIVEQLTALPDSPLLTGTLADDIRAVEQMVKDCPDYSEARRSQMQKHVNWILAPATLPQDMIIALGGNTTGRLIFGMGTFTLSEWGAVQKSATSCLLPIGKRLNDLIAANGEERISAFDTAG